MTTMTKGLEFDPGFAPYILELRGTVEYLYTDINRFKNFSQRKTKFLQYHKKILEVFYNNVGFYVGCLMWAVYLKSQPKQEILSNSSYGRGYNESDDTSGTQYMLNFAELFPKDMKYFLGQNFEFEPYIVKLIQIYEEFLISNKGFTETKYNTDINIPQSVKTENAKQYKTLIDEAIAQKDLSLLKENLEQII